MYWSFIRAFRVIEESGKKLLSAIVISFSFFSVVVFLLAIFNGILANIVSQFT